MSNNHDHMKEVVSTVDGSSVTRGELAAIFDKIKNEEHWKNPIDKIVEIKNDHEMAMIEEAVIFFTGSVPDFKPMSQCRPGRSVYHVTADGYFQAIGA